MRNDYSIQLSRMLTMFGLFALMSFGGSEADAGFKVVVAEDGRQTEILEWQSPYSEKTIRQVLEKDALLQKRMRLYEKEVPRDNKESLANMRQQLSAILKEILQIYASDPTHIDKHVLSLAYLDKSQALEQIVPLIDIGPDRRFINYRQRLTFVIDHEPVTFMLEKSLLGQSLLGLFQSNKLKSGLKNETTGYVDNMHRAADLKEKPLTSVKLTVDAVTGEVISLQCTKIN